MPRQQFGTDGPDYLVGYAIDDPRAFFDDEIYGLGGDDTIVLTTRSGLTWAGAGNDYISGGAMSDWLIGEAGDDQIFGGGGDDLLDGGDGADTIQGGFGQDTIFAGMGNDLIYGGGFSATGSAADGDDDIIQAGGGNDVAYGGAGNDIIYGDDSFQGRPYASLQNASPAMTDYVVTYRNSGADSLAGEGGDDWIFGFDGNDAINGGEGHDILLGGDGVDFILDMHGNNVIATGRGADTVMTGEGNDTVYSGGYRDFTAPRGPLFYNGYTMDNGEAPRSTALFAAETAEQYAFVRAGLGATGYWVDHYGSHATEPSAPLAMPSGPGDYIATGGGNDIIYAGEFNDVIFDGLGDDNIMTGGGADTLYLDGGIDVIQLTGTVSRSILLPSGIAGGAFTSSALFLNPETLVYDRASAVAAGNVDYIYGFSQADGDRIQYDDVLGIDVAFHSDGNGGTWLTNSQGIFASIIGVSPSEVQQAFFYI